MVVLASKQLKFIYDVKHIFFVAHRFSERMEGLLILLLPTCADVNAVSKQNFVHRMLFRDIY